MKAPPKGMVGTKVSRAKTKTRANGLGGGWEQALEPAKPVAAIARVEPAPLATPRRRAARLLQAFFEKRSELTVRNYRVDLVHFGRWWRAGGRDLDDRTSRRGRVLLDLDGVDVPDDLDERDAFVAEVLREFHSLEQLEALATVLAYQNDLKSGALGRVFAPQTVNHRITALRAVTEMARLLGMCTFDLSSVDLMEPSRVRKTEGCGAGGFERLVAQADIDVQEARGPKARLRATRNALILHLMHDSGLRRFEAIQPWWPDDVDLEGGRIRFRGKKRPSKEWFSGLNDDVVTAIRRHLDERGTDPGFLVYAESRKQSMDVSTVNRMITDLAARTGVGVTPHGLRHTVTTTLLEQTNGDVRSVAAFLRHKNTATVQIYDDDRKKLPQQMSKLLTKKKGS